MKKSPWRKTIWLAAACAAVWLLSLLAQNHPQVVETLYARGLYRVWAQVVSTVTGILPVSLSEIALLVLLPAAVIWAAVRLAKRRTNWQRVLSGALCVPLVGFLLFEGGWALNYSRMPYASIAGLEVTEVEVNTLEELVRTLALEAGALREELDPGDGAYELETSRKEVLRKEVGAAYARAAEQYPWLGGHFGAPKFALLSTPLAYLNIAGIFSPFTIEAHVNAHEADALLAATAMHEAAHLRGFAREDEANFIAWQVCRCSEDVYVRYSGQLLALIYAGNALNEADPARYRQVWQECYTPGVISDLAAYNAAWEPYEGQAAEVHERVNDAYLKANNQSDGVRSYGRMVDLLIAQMKKEKGE